ncbi:MAG: ATP synthase F1 subunit gamma [Bacteroidetes bacterium]|nr:ATP synthase F1 subunit gamma [Bacteroidota bacterium]MBU1720126.1 ATP synthase F1 subunit gamma [Bacteroidota bacterium]
MASLKEVRSRISSVKSTQQITSAMKMVSASKLRRAQESIVKMRPYAAKMSEILDNLVSGVAIPEDYPYTRNSPVQNVLIIASTGNKGLCGSFNTNIFKRVVRLLNEDFAEQHQAGRVEIFCLGKKGWDFFRKRGFPIAGSEIDLVQLPRFQASIKVSSTIMEDFANKKFDRVVYVYNKFKNAASQIVVAEQFLPVEVTESTEQKTVATTDYIFVPGKEEIIAELIPKTLRVQFYKNLLESVASEHGARMTAMHKATDNAGELLKGLRLSYNKARQAQITNEILEIVGGAEALKG